MEEFIFVIFVILGALGVVAVIFGIVVLLCDNIDGPTYCKGTTEIVENGWNEIQSATLNSPNCITGEWIRPSNVRTA
jgi:hypothetical protein